EWVMQVACHPTLIAQARRQRGIASAEHVREHAGTVTLEVVAVVPMKEERRQRRFVVRQLPAFYGLDDVEQPSANANAGTPSGAQLQPNIVTDIARSAVEAAARAHDRRGVRPHAAPWKA